MLKINNLSKHIGNRKILRSINLKVEEGMIYGFIGHNGAGKTTTMRSIVGLTKFEEGEIIINGKSFNNKVVTEDIVGYLPEDPSFYQYMTAKEYMKYLNQFSTQSNSMELLEMVGLKKAMNRRIKTYSRGMKQRLGMAAAIINQPKLLIMDEPTSALDPAGRYELFQMIKKLRDNGSTIILSTHILDDIEKVSDRIGIIEDGEILKEGNVEEILSSYFHPVFDVKLAECYDQEVIRYFEGFPWITDVTMEELGISLTVDDVEHAKEHIMKVLLKSNLRIIGFELRQPSLEDVFMREVSL